MDDISSLDQMPALSRTALRHEVVRRLLGAIFRAELPEGTRLVAHALARQFGISATPIREALLELETIGVVEFPHNRGGVVKAFGPRQVREIYHLRRILEAEATRCACGRVDRSALEGLKRKMAELLEETERPDWSEAVMEADQRLHRMVDECCDNERLRDEIRRYNTLIQTTREIVGNQHKAQSQALAEHLPILDALLAGEPETAAAAMARHIDNTAKAVEAVMFPNG